MKIIGLDFDNTIVEYEQLFSELGREMGYIDNESIITKEQVKKHIHKHYSKEIFTELQGIIYGKEMMKSKPANNVVSSLKELKARGYELKIISHKTMYPILGERINLHESARKWLSMHNICSGNQDIIEEGNIFFEETIEKKVERIKNEQCMIFIDDLVKVLKLVPHHIKRIHYMPEETKKIEWQGGPTLTNFKDLVYMIGKDSKDT